MKKLSALILFAGLAPTLSARPLPYKVSLGAHRNAAVPLVSLGDAAKEAAAEWKDRMTVSDLMREFEENILQKVQGATAWADPEDVLARTQRAFSKGIDSYALRASLDRGEFAALREYIRARRLVLELAEGHAIRAADKATPRFQAESQWCGDQGPACADGRLNRLIEFTAPGSTGTIEAQIEERMRRAEGAGNLESQIQLVNYDLRWDPPDTSVRYGVTFFFSREQVHHAVTVELLGYDLFYSNEATPEPWTPPAITTPFQALPPYKNAFYALSYPIDAVIGIKNAAFEVAKVPFSFLGGLFGRGKPLEYSAQNFKTAAAALKVELTHAKREGPAMALLRLLGEVPIAGRIFQYNTNPDDTSIIGMRRIYITRGIYGGDRFEQDTALWAAATHLYYGDAYVEAVPHEHGTVTDVVWSLLNFSHGQAYVFADEVMRTAKRGDRIYLAGHSAGVQRITQASRILSHHGYDVRGMMGLAGPSLGQACVNTLRPEPFVILLNPEGDVVSAVGAGAKGVATVLDLVTRQPVRFVGGLFARLDPDPERLDRWYRWVDKAGVSNATTLIVRPGLPARHETPVRFSLNHRIIFDRFVLQEYQNIFREDLGWTEVDGKRRIAFRD